MPPLQMLYYKGTPGQSTISSRLYRSSTVIFPYFQIFSPYAIWRVDSYNYIKLTKVILNLEKIPEIPTISNEAAQPRWNLLRADFISANKQEIHKVANLFPKLRVDIDYCAWRHTEP